jgi:multiple sugar transport system permease protein
MSTQTTSRPRSTRPHTGAVPARRAGRGMRPSSIVAVIVLAVLAIAWLAPVLWAFATSLKTEADAGAVPVTWIGPHGITFDAYAKVLGSGQIPQWALNSLLTSVIITVVTVVISALAGYAFSRIDFSGRRWLFAVVIGSIVIPGQVLIVPLFYEMLTLNLIDTYWGIILPQLIAPAMVFILKKFFDQIPIELEDAARVDGASRLRIFTQVVIPLSRPIIAAVSIFVFIGAWNNFLWPFIVVNDSSLMTLPVGLQTVKSAFGVQYAQNMASALLAALPLILVFLFFQRHIIKGVSSSGFGNT